MNEIRSWIFYKHYFYWLDSGKPLKMNIPLLIICFTLFLIVDVSSLRALTRCEVLDAAQRWVDDGVMYSWDAWYTDPTTGWCCYRTDCSGCVSAVWRLPPPGHTTYSFAGGPWDDGVSYVIDASELQPGDALNYPGDPSAGTGHIMLYVSGDFYSGSVEVYEEYGHGHPAVRRWRTINPSIYLPIRLNGIEPCTPQYPLFVLNATILSIEGQERDFCMLNGSEGKFDMHAGQTTIQQFDVTNIGTAVGANVVVGIWVEEPYLVIRHWDIYDNYNWSGHTCGEEWCLNDANSHPENPAHDNPGSSFLLHLYAVSPGETKRIQMLVEAQESSYGVENVDHPDIRMWVKHVDNFYEKADFWSIDYNNVGGYQTFNGGDLRIWSETDVVTEEVCGNGIDDDCDGEIDEGCVSPEQPDEKEVESEFFENDEIVIDGNQEMMDVRIIESFGENDGDSGSVDYITTGGCGCEIVPIN